MNPTAAPMFALASDFMLVPVAFAIPSAEFVARTMTAPLVPVIERLFPTEAELERVTTLIAIAAATPTPLLPWPDSELEVLLELDVWSLAFGTEPVVPLEFGLSCTWRSASVSALSPPLSLPAAEAFDSTRLAVDDVAAIVTEAAVRLRSTVALVVDSMIAIATAAPIAASSPPASPSAFRLDSNAAPAVMEALPVAVSAEPVPRRAEVSSVTIAIETDGLTATPPAEPALLTVETMWNESAAIVTLAPPEKVAPFSIAARVVRSSRMFSATEAPIPTVPPFASEVASAVSLSLLFARSATLPMPAATEAAPPTIPRVWLETMLSASAPAMPTLSLPAPAFACAEMSCSASRKKSPLDGLPGRTSAVGITPVLWRSHEDELSVHL